jgi:hypothetical protein
MAIYNGSARQLLVQLINEANPGLPFEVNTVDYDFTVPAVIDPATNNGRNTEIFLVPKTSSQYTGSIRLTYNRLDLGLLFRNVIPHVQKWVPNTGTEATTVIEQLHTLLPLYSAKYGIPLETSQIRDLGLQQRWGINPSLTFQMQAEPTSLIYIGSVQSKWEIGKRTLESLYQNTEVEGRLYPNGNDFTDIATRKPYLSHFTFNDDFTLNPPPFSNNIIASNYITIPRFMNEHIAHRLGLEPNVFATTISYASPVDVNDSSASRGIRDLRYRSVNLPHPDYPEANSDLYNRLSVMEIPDDCGWGCGNLYFHYNV